LRSAHHTRSYVIRFSTQALDFIAGSSFAWSKYTDSQSDNLVPIEIALRIVHAIEHDERFAAYLLIPLHPERPGPQRSLIMLYTWHTIIMMYK
jgi:phospholipase D1/2